MAIDSNDNIYVADRSSNIIQVFDSDGNFITTFKEPGYPDDQFSSYAGLAIDSSDNLYVANSDNYQIRKISFEDAIVTFSEQFEKISCNAHSMMNDPISVPQEIASAFPVSELLPRANGFAESGHLDESLLFYYIASQIDSENVHVWNGIGYSQTFLCDNNSAIDAYSNTLTLDENNVNALNGLGFFYSNHAQEQSRNNAPDDLVQSTANLAIASYENALELDDSNVNALNGISTVHIVLGQYDQAIENFVLSFALDSDRISTLNGMAFAHMKSGNLVLAESFYDDALDVDDNNFDALSGLLSIYIQQDKHDKANETIAKLAQFQEQVVQSLIAEAQWLMDNGSADDEAKRFLKKALQLDPGNVIAKDLLRKI